MLLAAGIGVQLGHIAAVWPSGFSRVVRRTLPVAFGLPVVLEHRAGGGLATSDGATGDPRPAGASSRGKPNVLLIVWDTVRGQSLSALWLRSSDATPS